MSATIAPWPVCPPPHDGESLHSWFERVAACYGLSAHRMLSRGALDFRAVTPGRNTPYFPGIFEHPAVMC